MLLKKRKGHIEGVLQIFLKFAFSA